MRGRKPNPPPAAKTGGIMRDTPSGTAEITEPAWAILSAPGWGAGAADTAALKWRELAALMGELGTLGPENASVLELACVQWARWRLAEAEIAKLGPLIKAPVTGVPMVNPYLSIANQAADRFIKLAAELGLTPAMRGRVTKRPLRSVAGVRPLAI